MEGKMLAEFSGMITRMRESSLLVQARVGSPEERFNRQLARRAGGIPADELMAPPNRS